MYGCCIPVQNLLQIAVWFSVCFPDLVALWFFLVDFGVVISAMLEATFKLILRDGLNGHSLLNYSTRGGPLSEEGARTLRKYEL